MMFLLSGSSSCYLSMLVRLSHSSSELELCQNFTTHVVPWLEQVSGIAGSHCTCSWVYFLIGSMQHKCHILHTALVGSVLLASDHWLVLQ